MDDCSSMAEECVSMIGDCSSKAEECVSMIDNCAPMATDRPSSFVEPSAKIEKHPSKRDDCWVDVARCPTSTAES